MPARDAARTLAAALASVRAQTFPDWEAIVVDDGSRDSTAAIVRRIGALDPRVRLLSIPPSGIVTALNAGLARCRGRLVARFDADDVMHRERLEAQVELLGGRPELAGVGSLVQCFPRHRLRDGMRRYERWLNSVVGADAILRERFVESPLVHPSMTLRRDVLEDAGGWHESVWAEDWDLWLRLMERGHRFEKVPRVLHYWRDHPIRLTRTDVRYAPETLTQARAHYLARGPLRERAAVIWGAGPIGKSLLRALDGAGARVEGLIDVDPRKIGQQVHGRRVEAPASLDRRPRPVLLAAVGAEGAREEIRAAAVGAGFVEGSDFFACA